MKNQNEKGQFVKGNVLGKGRPKGSISITTEIKRELKKCPPGEKRTYLQLFIKRIISLAIRDGDERMIALIWAYIDGKPKESIDFLNEELPFKIVIEKNDGKDNKKS